MICSDFGNSYASPLSVEATPVAQGGHVIINGAPSNQSFSVQKPYLAEVNSAKSQAATLGGKVLNVARINAGVSFDTATVNFYMPDTSAASAAFSETSAAICAASSAVIELPLLLDTEGLGAARTQFLYDLYNTRDMNMQIRDGWDFVNPYHFLITLTAQVPLLLDTEGLGAARTGVEITMAPAKDSAINLFTFFNFWFLL